jgi:hypothetical protein
MSIGHCRFTPLPILGAENPPAPSRPRSHAPRRAHQYNKMLKIYQMFTAINSIYFPSPLWELGLEIGNWFSQFRVTDYPAKNLRTGSRYDIISDSGRLPDGGGRRAQFLLKHGPHPASAGFLRLCAPTGLCYRHAVGTRFKTTVEKENPPAAAMRPALKRACAGQPSKE